METMESGTGFVIGLVKVQMLSDEPILRPATTSASNFAHKLQWMVNCFLFEDFLPNCPCYAVNDDQMTTNCKETQWMPWKP